MISLIGGGAAGVVSGHRLENTAYSVFPSSLSTYRENILEFITSGVEKNVLLLLLLVIL